MEANLQRRVQRYGWDKASQYYENSWQAQLRPAHDLLMQMANPQPGEQVLDIAAGTGLVTFRLAERVGEKGNVQGTDISDEMVKMGQQLAASRGFNHVEFKRMGAEELEIDDGIFDLAVCALGLMYVPEIDTAFNEMYRVLKPAGRASAAVWGQRKNCGWADIFPIVDSRVSSDVCPLFFQLGTGDFLKQSFEQAGFREVRIERIDTILKYPNAEKACDAAFLGGPVALAYARFNDQLKEEARTDYVKSIEPFRTDSGFLIPGEFVVGVGVK